MTELTDKERQRIRRLVKRLRRSNPVRIEAEAFLRGDNIHAGVAHSAARELDPIDQAKTRQYLASLLLLPNILSSDEDNSETSQYLEDVVARPRRTVFKRSISVISSSASWTFRTFVLAICVYFVGLPMRWLGAPDTYFRIWGLLIIALGISALFVMPFLGQFLEARRSNQTRSGAAVALGKIGNARSVVALATAAREARLESSTYPALASLLPLVQHDHYPKLSRELTPALIPLITETHGSLFLDILNALKRAGNGSAVQPLERLARSTHSDTIRELVNQTLVVLRKRRENEQNAERLLRPTNAPGENLLRPAGNEHIDEALLLRPTTETD